MSEGLQYSNTHYYFNMLRETIEPEVPNQCSRFGFPADVEQWERDLTIINNFLAYLNTRIRIGLDKFYEEIVGLEEMFGSFLCYPNPSSGVIHLCLDSEAMNADEISIYDMMGRKVFAQPCQLSEGMNEIVLHPDLMAGIYVLKIGDKAIEIVRQ